MKIELALGGGVLVIWILAKLGKFSKFQDNFSPMTILM